MSLNNIIKYQDEEYFDDRLFVLHLCKSTVKIQQDGIVATTVYHEDALSDHLWCIVSYRNCNRYPIFSVDSFHRKDDAVSYLQNIEPSTPLISLNGNSPQHPLSYEDYCLWKKKNAFNEYDYKPFFSSDGANPREVIFQRIEEFQGIL